HFQLTARLWPSLKRSGRSRVVSVSSTGIRFGGVDFDDPNFLRHRYDKWKAYGQSKSANALFAVALDRFGEPHCVRAFAVHPGRIATDLARFLSDEERAVGGEYKTTEQAPRRACGVQQARSWMEKAASSAWTWTSRPSSRTSRSRDTA